MVAAWRRGGTVDTFVVPTLMGLGAFPAFFTALLGVYFFGLKLGWFPIQHAYDSGLMPGFNWAFLRAPCGTRELPVLVIMAAFTGGWVLNMRTVMINTISEDYVAMAQAKGLKDRRVMTRYAGRNAILPPLNGFAAQFAGAVGGLVFVEYVFSYPGAGLTLQQAALGNDYPLTQGLLLVFAFAVIAANFLMDLAQLRPRSTGAGQLMSQLQPVIEPEAIPLAVSAPRKQQPHPRAGSRCCSRTRSRASASTLLAFMVVVGGDRAVDLRQRPDRLQPRSRRGRRRPGITCSARPTRAATSSRRSSSAPAAR